MRHLAKSKEQTAFKWGHRIIAIIELCPGIGLIATIIEAIVVKCINIFASVHTIPTPSSTVEPSIVNKIWLFKGTQQECNGIVLKNQAEAICEKLQNQRPLGIHFNKNKIVENLIGGTCTAMSLEFIDSYFKIKNAQVESPDYKAELLITPIQKISERFAKSSETMRIRQAAHNTIEVEKVKDEIDHSRNKIESLAITTYQ